MPRYPLHRIPPLFLPFLALVSLIGLAIETVKSALKRNRPPRN